jgi:hypothetical protein
MFMTSATIQGISRSPFETHRMPVSVIYVLNVFVTHVLNLHHSCGRDPIVFAGVEGELVDEETRSEDGQVRLGGVFFEGALSEDLPEFEDSRADG